MTFNPLSPSRLLVPIRGSGWLKETGERAARRPARRPARDVDTRFLTAKKALVRICDITGVKPGQLRVVEHGPRANPARRFAVWALKNQTQLTHPEIGNLLGMSVNQVAHVLRRTQAKEESMATWVAQW